MKIREDLVRRWVKWVWSSRTKRDDVCDAELNRPVAKSVNEIGHWSREWAFGSYVAGYEAGKRDARKIKEAKR